MNEELQSTNEELETINDELRSRSDELNLANGFLESVFTSLRAGVAVVDSDQRVQVWNERAEELWGVRAAEAEHLPFHELDIGLPVGKLAPQIRECLAGELQELELSLPAVNRRGRAIQCLVRVRPLVARGSTRPRGVIVLMEEQAAPGDAGGVAGSADGA